jgi:hypothetical protein
MVELPQAFWKFFLTHLLNQDSEQHKPPIVGTIRVDKFSQKKDAETCKKVSPQRKKLLFNFPIRARHSKTPAQPSPFSLAAVLHPIPAALTPSPPRAISLPGRFLLIGLIPKQSGHGESLAHSHPNS